jgi:short-subunit dehydrogenase
MKKVIIVGASSGIGKGLARLMANNQYVIGITGRRIKLLETLKKENKNAYITCYLDVTETDTIAGKLDNLVKQLGGMDVLIISAGTGEFNEELSFPKEKTTIETNINGFTAVADWGFNYFSKQASGQIVGITSIAGIRGGRSAPAYNASKSYQISYLEGLNQKAKQAKLNINITDVRPGFVDTDMAKGSGLFWVSSVEKASGQIFKSIERKDRVVYVTRRWRLVAWILKIIPGKLFERM